MKTKLKRALYLVERGDALIKAARVAVSDGGKEFTAFQSAPCPAGDAAQAAQRIAELLLKMGWRNDDIAFSLPRHLATLRYIKVPARDPVEIERMIAFQAPRHLPYPAEELVTGYEVLETDKAGYSHVNLIIVHREAVAAYLEVCRHLKVAHPFIALSSYGLSRTFAVLKPEEQSPAIVLDIDDHHAECAVICQGQLTFSRALKFHGFQNGWQALLLEELGRTLEVYAKEVSPEPPGKIFLMGGRRSYTELSSVLLGHTRLLVEALPMNGHIPITDSARTGLEEPVSYFALFGLGLMEQQGSLSLLPAALKTRMRRRDVMIEQARTSLVFASAALFLGLSLSLSVHNKAVSLGRLKAELNRVQKEAAPLVEIDRRVAVLKKALGTRSGLNALYGIYTLVPESVSLNTFEYSDLGKVLLRGQAKELETVFALARGIEGAAAFKGYAVVVNYATKKKTVNGESVDFEISGKKP